ncbi:DUF429 domain-containing protein [Crateriforma conspicua]|uniref:DUF429 domain-containing protein n=1 Tax=Crateriforma conspicua TaxID=2527996 RepID=A0A5C6FUX6_9PLAN|nr:DUF429 domain-containing protein [Crateriforma conspicua]TWU65238.1 hypothetical protein V7x_07840 [Crateriforma conspicua]
MVNAIDPAAPLIMPWISAVYGVDFSGAAESGKTAWCATLDVQGGSDVLRLVDLKPLGKWAGCDSRDAVCGELVRRIQDSHEAYWAVDFPFGLPVELQLGGWDEQLQHVAAFDGDAKQYGRKLVAITQQYAHQMHVRRRTDTETKTPFDCYHYRIIYQTFHGMRDVLRPLSTDADTAILPFTYDRFSAARRIIAEACPSSSLKRWGLPYQRYKQSAGRPPGREHRKVRRQILAELSQWVELSDYRKRILLSDPGGDALDAVIAGVGSWQTLRLIDHQAIATDDRYPLEGFVYA